MKVVGLVCLMLGLLASRVNAQVVVMNFDDLTLNNYDAIPSNYGLSLDSRLSGVSFRTLTATTDATLTNYVEFWNSDYGDLSKVAFASSNGYTAEISLTPQSGYSIRLVSFDMAGYSSQTRTNSVMRLTDGSNKVLYDFASAGPVTVLGTGRTHSTFTPNFTHAGTLRLQWGTDWNVGLDNLRFELVAIPEPASWAMMAGGAPVVAWWLRRGGRRGRRGETLNV